MDYISPDQMREMRASMEISATSDCAERALPIFEIIIRRFIEETESCIEPSWQLGIESEVFSMLYSELQVVKLKTLADLLALSLNSILVPTSEGVAAVALSCQLVLLALASIQDIRPEFRTSIKANILRRYRGSVASEYCIGLGLPEGIVLPGDNPEDYGPLESNRLNN